MLKKKLFVLAILGMWIQAEDLYAKVTFSPYVNIRSTKSVNPTKSKNKSSRAKTETETVKQHQEYGLAAGLSFWRLLKFQMAVGQSNLKTTEKVSEIKDEYGKLNMRKELEIPDETAGEVEVTTVETQRIARASLLIDPSIGFIILRAKIGVTGRQRAFSLTLGDGTTKKEFTPTYGLHSGAGFGIKFSPRFYAMAEYGFEHYNFPPDIEPFERQLTVGFNISI